MDPVFRTTPLFGFLADSTVGPRPEHPRFPYLLRHLAIVRPDQVWASDITYVPLERGWAYLVVVMDWFSRAVLAWRLSNTLSVEFCLEALEEALGQWGPPEIFNTDQGAQYTAIEWVAVLLAHEVRVSMDGKGRWMDNVFVERLWRSLKYEAVYPFAYATVHQAWAGISRWLHFYSASLECGMGVPRHARFHARATLHRRYARARTARRSHSSSSRSRGPTGLAPTSTASHSGS